MGLDMIPMGKPKPGYENEFRRLFDLLTSKEAPKISLVDKLLGRTGISKEELLKKWLSIQIPTYETIKAPKVGRDQEAEDWVRQKYKEQKTERSEDEFISGFEGYYVTELAKELDGVPVYFALGQDEIVFRGQFLDDCVDLIGEDLASEAWKTKLAPEALDYGRRLMTIADKIGSENGLLYLRTQRLPPDNDQHSLESKLHIVYSLAKWLIFYGENGHGYEADF